MMEQQVGPSQAPVVSLPFVSLRTWTDCFQQNPRVGLAVGDVS